MSGSPPLVIASGLVASSEAHTRFIKSFISGISTGDIERGFVDDNERGVSDRVIDDSEGGLADSALSSEVGSDACSSFKLPVWHTLHSHVSRTEPDWSSGSQKHP